MQKLLLFMMQKSMNSCKFVIGGIYSVSLENFTTVTWVASLTINFISSLSQNNEFISACEHVTILLHGNLFRATMKPVKGAETVAAGSAFSIRRDDSYLKTESRNNSRWM